MSVFKCKMCGGAVIPEQNGSVGTCEYCGTRQTIAKLDDEKKANLYDRADHFRRNNDFDKAMAVYEQILNEDSTDAESYWSLVLCRYGIEYVEDPSSHRRIPTVNRAQFTSVLADEDYKSALQYADAYQKTIYEEEARAIDEIQKGILEISQKEEPFDVFICYKETDASGRRTPDSVLATELYHELTKEGFKVFFSRITLEDKLGTAYEPYIFAALNSAKVMVVLGTKPEYFNAVWVKNEWSRYLALIRNGAKKMLIPAYRDMDPYDLPDEFSHLQAQDMSKLGFMQDLIRGITKILQSSSAENKVSSVSATPVSEGTANADNLLKRVAVFIEDGDWAKAGEYCERILDSDVDNEQASFYKFLISRKARSLNSINKNDTSVIKTPEFRRIYNIATGETKKQLDLFIVALFGNIVSALEENVDFGILDIMLKNGVEINEHKGIGDCNYTPLTYAIRKNNFEAVRYLVEHGADVNLPRIDSGKFETTKHYPLSDAITKAKSLEMVKYLVEHGAEVNKLSESVNKYGITYHSPLSDAIWYTKSLEMVKYLVEHGADVNRVEHIYSDDGTTGKKSMLTYAVVDAQNFDMVECLVEHGADLTVPRELTNKNGTNYYPPLSDAVFSAQDFEIAESLVEHGADVNQPRIYADEFATTKHYPLSDAIWKAKSARMVKCLVEYGADVNVPRERTNQYGTTCYSPLSDAIWNSKNFEMVKYLVEHGADVNRVEHVYFDSGKTGKKSMLTYAVADAKDVEMVKCLVEHGADVNVPRENTNQYGTNFYSPLSDAIWNSKSLEIVKYLVEHGADVNRVEFIFCDNGETEKKSMLAYAVVNINDIEMAKYLIEHGASWNDTFEYKGVSKPMKKYPFDKVMKWDRKYLLKLKELGWHGSGLFGYN